MKKILLVNPPIYDFTAYDFWLKPFGLLRVAGFLRGKYDMELFDFMDRESSLVPNLPELRSDSWGRGEFVSEIITKPDIYEKINRHYKRFGISKEKFTDFLSAREGFDYVLIQTTMTFWYPGVKEVIEEVRRIMPGSRIVLGGVYATIIPGHARSLGADFVLSGLDLTPLWNWMGENPSAEAWPYWEGYEKLTTGVLKLAEGCPFRCTYCSVPQVYPKFWHHAIGKSIGELERLMSRGVSNVAFYDDALLFQPEKILKPFLREIIKRGWKINLHTPNALNARFITQDLARLMLEAGFKKIYMGFESSAYRWQKKTGGKVYSHEFTGAVNHLVSAGARQEDITAYIIAGHPAHDDQGVAESMKFANGEGVRVMLSEFSPIPGTPDGEACRKYVDLDEPLWHNKTAFPCLFLGENKMRYFKDLARTLNKSLAYHSAEA